MSVWYPPFSSGADARASRKPEQSGSYTIGVEDEYQLVDSVTFELGSGIRELERAAWSCGDGGLVGRELLQCMVEVRTGVATTVEEAVAELAERRARIGELARGCGLRIAAAGTHPFSALEAQAITDTERYRELERRSGYLARRNCVFGLHVHVGVDSREKLIAAANALRSVVPEFVALAANSPFGGGLDSGFSSMRASSLAAFPRSGLPPAFASWDDYSRMVERGVRLGVFPDDSYLWWDVRPCARLGTVELRACDAQTRVGRVGGIVALAQALVATVGEAFDRGVVAPPADDLFLAENRLRAARDGLDATLIDVERDTDRSVRVALLELLDRCEPAARRLGCATELHRVGHLLAEPSGADEQRAVHAETGSLRAVVDWLAATTTLDLLDAPTPVA